MPRLVKTVVILAAVVFFFIFIVWPFSPAGKQAHNLKIADTQIPNIQTVLKQYPVFDDLRVGRFTGGGGGIMLYGHIENEEDKEKLYKVIAQLNLPFYVKYTFTSNPVHAIKSSE